MFNQFQTQFPCCPYMCGYNGPFRQPFREMNPTQSFNNNYFNPVFPENQEFIPEEFNNNFGIIKATTENKKILYYIAEGDERGFTDKFCNSAIQIFDYLDYFQKMAVAIKNFNFNNPEDKIVSCTLTRLKISCEGIPEKCIYKYPDK